MIHDIDYIIVPELAGKRIKDVSALYIPFWLIGREGREVVKGLQSKYKRWLFWGVLILCL